MKRELLQMEDPVIPEGNAAAARAPITVTPAGVPCRAQLFIGLSETNKAVSSPLINFTSTGLPQNIDFQLTMPSVGGAVYKVFIDVWSGDLYLKGYLGNEDVIVPHVQIDPVTWS